MLAPNEESKLVSLIKIEIDKHSKLEELFKRLQEPCLRVGDYIFKRNARGSDSTSELYILQQNSDFGVDFRTNGRLVFLQYNNGDEIVKPFKSFNDAQSKIVSWLRSYHVEPDNKHEIHIDIDGEQLKFNIDRAFDLRHFTNDLKQLARKHGFEIAKS